MRHSGKTLLEQLCINNTSALHISRVCQIILFQVFFEDVMCVSAHLCGFLLLTVLPSRQL